MPTDTQLACKHSNNYCQDDYSTPTAVPAEKKAAKAEEVEKTEEKIKTNYSATAVPDSVLKGLEKGRQSEHVKQ